MKNKINTIIENDKLIHVKDDFYKGDWIGALPVNKKGEVLLEDGTITKGQVNIFWPYLTVFKVNIHRIVVMTYLECPGDPKDYQVNHIDGDKLNNNLENLEWCTASENIIHAYKTGLRNDNRPLLIKDLETNKIERFYSLQEAARAFNVNASLFTYYLKPKKTKIIPWRKKYSIIYEGDEWPEGLKVGEQRGVEKDMVVVFKDTGNKYIFTSATIAAKFLKIKYSALSWYLNRRGAKKSNTYKDMEFWYMDDYIKEHGKVKADKSIGKKQDYKNHTFTKGVRRKPSKVKVTNLETGEVSMWDSLWKIAEMVDMKKNTLEKLLWRNKGIFNNCKFEYIKP